MYYPRTLSEACLAASEQFPVVLLTEPRQVGKTTLLQHLAKKNRRYVTLDDPTARTLAQSDPALFLERYEPPVLIGEIQYAPQLLPLIKMAVDRRGRKKVSFWLTGSQQFHLMKGISETLAGRVAILNLLGFSNRERRRRELNVAPFVPTAAVLKEREKSAAPLGLKQLYEDIWRGSYPAIATRAVRDRDLFYDSYLRTYLQRDVRDLARVGDEIAFMRFLQACAARTGQLLNLSELARDADVAVNTAKNWLSILQTSFQIALLPSYHTNLTKRLVKMPKLYFLDTGLCAYLAEWSTAETLEAGAMGGAILETYVFAEVLKSWWNRGKQPRLYYYRDKDGKEIDLLLVQDRAMYPIEIKKSASPRPEWLRQFGVLDRLHPAWTQGGAICLCRELIPLSPKATAIPIGLL
ncbi:MAG TPA: ATP-binding protein [Phycisphaerae bacterium]|nr:ATP-binding protein [Phycisphaerae bacterium]